jgi:hypothetical protein
MQGADFVEFHTYAKFAEFFFHVLFVNKGKRKGPRPLDPAGCRLTM